MLKVNLKLGQRYVIVNVIPQQGTFATISTIEPLVKKLGPSKLEVKVHKIKTIGQQARWEPDHDLGVGFEFDDMEVKIIKEGFEAVEKRGALQLVMLDLYKLFVMGQELPEEEEEEKKEEVEKEEEKEEKVGNVLPLRS